MLSKGGSTAPPPSRSAFQGLSFLLCKIGLQGGLQDKMTASGPSQLLISKAFPWCLDTESMISRFHVGKVVLGRRVHVLGGWGSKDQALSLTAL